MQISVFYPSSFKCLLQNGQNVDFDTLYLEQELSTDIAIAVAKKLRIKPNHIFRYLKKFVGEKIHQGEILAEKKGLIGATKVIINQEGIIKEIDHNQGLVIISTPQEKTKSIKAFFKGEVLEIKKGIILIKVKKGESFPIKNAINNFGGETFYFLNKFTDLLNSQLSNKIVISESVSDYFQTKIETLGAKGFVLLNKLPQNTNTNFAQIKNIDDFKKIIKLKFPYCLINKDSSTIYFYQ